MDLIYNYFVLGYNAINYFEQWYDFNQFTNTNLSIIDNGRQSSSEKINPYIIHTNKKNIGCAGGWNLICDIGFNHYGFEKIIIGQEDARISESIFDALLEECNPNTLCGTFNNGFTFSTFAIHRDTFHKVGRFDENIVYVGCEDNDYQYRCELNEVEVKCLGISNGFNCSIANNDDVKPPETSPANANYVHTKWGDYKYKTAFNGIDVPKYSEWFTKLYGNPDEWPSETEYTLFLKGKM